MVSLPGFRAPRFQLGRGREGGVFWRAMARRSGLEVESRTGSDRGASAGRIVGGAVGPADGADGQQPDQPMVSRLPNPKADRAGQPHYGPYRRFQMDREMVGGRQDAGLFPGAASGRSFQ